MGGEGGGLELKLLSHHGCKIALSFDHLCKMADNYPSYNVAFESSGFLFLLLPFIYFLFLFIYFFYFIFLACVCLFSTCAFCIY